MLGSMGIFIHMKSLYCGSKPVLQFLLLDFASQAGKIQIYVFLGGDFDFFFLFLIIVIIQMQRLEKSRTMGKARIKHTNSTHRHAMKIQQQTPKEIDTNLYSKFLKFMSQTRMQNLKQKITYFYGRNFPIKYNSKYKFLEQWQDLQKRQERNLYDVIHEQDNLLVKFIVFLVMISNTVIVWAITINRFFKNQYDSNELKESSNVLGLITCLISLLIKIYLKFRQNQGMPSYDIISKTIFKDILSFIYFSIGFINYDKDSLGYILFQIGVCLYLYLAARKYYKFVRLMQYSLIYQYQFKIFDLMVNLLILAHFFSLVIFAATWANSDLNWTTVAGIAQQSFITKYIYSFYFCSTTILTIGYGDISPRNSSEVMVVCLIQLVGVIIFGYLINQIGHTLSILRRNQENLQKDLSTLGKIQKFYNIQKSLVNRAKGYLVNNQHAMVQLTPQDQNVLLSKLNEDLRSDIINQKSLSIVKSSIFFLCRWSKHMQTNVAMKLQKILLAPNERLLQPPGKQRIYIIKRGKIQVHIDRFGPNKRQFRRLLKVISVDDPQSICDNIYGYTAVISIKSCALDAVASEFTSAYFIQKQAFLKCILAHEVDFQYFHQVKNRIDLSQFCQAYEAPSILNIRQHYNPSRTILIRKQRAYFAKCKNIRTVHIRSKTRRCKKHHFKGIEHLLQEINDKLINNSSDFIELTLTFKTGEINDQFCLDKYNKDAKSMVQSSESSSNEEMKQIFSRQRKGTLSQTLRNSQLMNLRSGIIAPGEQFLPIIKKWFPYIFERSWQYGNFFSTNNLSNVLKQIENQNYNTQKKQQQINIQMYSTKQLSFGFLESKTS